MSKDNNKQPQSKFFVEHHLTKKQYRDQWNSPKAKIEDLFYLLHKELHLERIGERSRFIPHITLIPPVNVSSPSTIEEIMEETNNFFAKFLPKPEEIYYEINKPTILPYEGKKYLVLNAIPSGGLIRLRKVLRQTILYNKQIESPYSYKIDDWLPHIEIGDSTQIRDMNTAKNIAEEYIDKNLLHTKEYLARISFIQKINKQKKIFSEFDLYRGEWLNRYEALENSSWMKTVESMEKILKEK